MYPLQVGFGVSKDNLYLCIHLSICRCFGTWSAISSVRMNSSLVCLVSWQTSCSEPPDINGCYGCSAWMSKLFSDIVPYLSACCTFVRSWLGIRHARCKFELNQVEINNCFWEVAAEVLEWYCRINETHPGIHQFPYKLFVKIFMNKLILPAHSWRRRECF